MSVAVREAPDISAARYDRRKQFVPEYAVGAGNGIDAVERLDAEADGYLFNISANSSIFFFSCA